MADVRGAPGVPAAAAFSMMQDTPTPVTPVYVNTTNGDLYVLVAGVPTKVANAATAAGAVWGA